MSMAAYRARAASLQKIQRDRDLRGNQEIRDANLNDPSVLPDLKGFAKDKTFDPNATVLPDPKPSMMTKLLSALSFTTDKIDRATQATREIALYANKTTSLEGFKKRFAGAINGDVKRMSRQEFTELMVGSETYARMQRTQFIPDWGAALLEPVQAMMGKKGQRAGVTGADAFSVGLDFFVDPFTLLALTPVGAGSKVGSAISKTIKYPFRPVMKGLNALMGPGSNSPLSFLNFVRQPEDVLPQQMFRAIAAGKFQMEENLNKVLPSVQQIFKGIKYRGKEDQLLAAAVHGLKVGSDGFLRAGKTALTGDSQKVFNQIMPIVQSHIDELIAAGHLTKKQVAGAPLASFYPKLIGKHSIPMDIWQSWDASKIGQMNLKIRQTGQNTGPIRFENVSGVDSIRDFIYGARRKLDMEPVLVKFAPGGNHAATLLEDPLTKSLSVFQRRYLTDLTNTFTGNQKGRKLIQFDMLVGDFFHRMEGTAWGNRVAKLYHKLGNGTTSDGLADFSTTTKLSGMWSHNIIRATLGGNLSSAVQNLTQTLNFAIADGMPATIKGMLKFGDPKMRGLRATANLQRDMTSMWDEAMWAKNFGQSWDKVIFSGFTAAENVIRGTGFHIGLSQYLKKNKLKSIEEAISLGHKKKMIEFAHFESINGAFIYGNLGKAPMFSNPMLKPATTLLSYPFKQGEFLRRSFVKDGGSLLRFIGLHGLLIEKANDHLGIAAEDFLGWGFTPMTQSFAGIPLPASPPVSAALNIASMLESFGTGDFAKAEIKMKNLIDFSKRDALGLPTGELPIALGAAGLPWLGIKDVTKLLDVWHSKRQEIGGDGFAPLAHKEAIANYIIGRSTTQKLRSDLKRRQLRADRKIDFEQDRRAKKFVNSIFGTDGNDVGKAGWEAAQGIEVEGRLFYPEPESFLRRVDLLVEKRTVSDDIRQMIDSGFVARMFILPQLELFQRSSTGQ